MEKRAQILILDGMWNKTLAATRSLGKRGFRVTVGESSRFSASLFSKYCSRRVIYPSPQSNPDLFLRWLLKEVKTCSYDMLLPMELSTQLLCVKNRSEIEKYTIIPFSDYDLTSKINDKGWLLNYALSKKFDCPQTYFIEDVDSLRSLKIRLDFPVVIKPKVSSGSRGIEYVHNPDDFIPAYLRVHKKYPYPLIQEFIPNGGAFGVAVLCDFNHEPVISFVYERLREYPVSGGPSTLRESVHHEAIKKMAESLLCSLGWTGVAMVEFRVDRRDQKPKLMEINPRFWGSLHLAIMAGVDFPYLLYQMAVLGKNEKISPYKTGVKTRWLIPGDLMHFLSNPNRFRMKPGFFSKTDGDDILSLEDPLPLLGRLTSALPFFYQKEMKKLLTR